jgi:hypothetical protein
MREGEKLGKKERGEMIQGIWRQLMRGKEKNMARAMKRERERMRMRIYVRKRMRMKMMMMMMMKGRRKI